MVQTLNLERYKDKSVSKIIIVIRWLGVLMVWTQSSLEAIGIMEKIQIQSNLSPVLSGKRKSQTEHSMLATGMSVIAYGKMCFMEVSMHLWEFHLHVCLKYKGTLFCDYALFENGMDSPQNRSVIPWKYIWHQIAEISVIKHSTLFHRV